jgi:4-aminobutyrate aminotransferase
MKPLLSESTSLKTHEREATLYIKGSPAQETLLPLTLVAGSGEWVFDADGREYLDFAAGLLVPCGHAFEPVVAAVRCACGELEACEDYTNPYRAELGESLKGIFPDSLGGVQYYSSGTEAVEAGLRLMRAISGRDGFVGFHGSYHGKTLGAAAVAGMKAWNDTRPTSFAQVPFCCVGPEESAIADVHVAQCLDELHRELDAGTPDHIAGVVIEAIQGGAGVRIPPLAFLLGVQELCRAYGVLLMVDEVFTGMARTGSFFAYQQFGMDPDLVAVGKGLGNGFPITAILVHDRHADSVREVEGGTTYGGNPVSCAAAVQTLASVVEEGLPERAASTGEAFRVGLEPLRQVAGVADVRTMGCLAAIEFADASSAGQGEAHASAVYESCCQRGLLTTPRGSTLRLSPPLMVSDASRQRAVEIVGEVVRSVCESS